MLDECIFTDSAISGATDERAGLQRLLAAAQMKPRPFDVILVDDTSRLSRKLSDALRIKERLDFAGIRVIFVSQGFDSSAPQSQTLLTVHGLVDGLYLDGLREKTFRGVEQLALQRIAHWRPRVWISARSDREPNQTRQLRTAGDRRRAAASRSEPGADDPENFRAIRRRSFHEADRDRSQPRRDSFAATARRQAAELGAIFRASHFAERTLSRRRPLGKTKKIRSPETGKRIYRRKPESEWRRREIPEQRIVSEELWKRTHERLKLVQQCSMASRDGKRRGRAAACPYLFTGLLDVRRSAAESITIVSGHCKKRADSRYGCSRHAQRGDSVCKNNLS